jgi:hypothetical protein
MKLKNNLTMTQEEKLLLLKDLCSRLPYGIKAEVTNTQGYHHDNVAKKGEKKPLIL